MNWKIRLKQLLCWHKWVYGDDVTQKNRRFKWCDKCKTFRYVRGFKK